MRPSTTIPARYHVTESVEPVDWTIHWAIVGANAPPRIAPIAYEIETPEKRMDAGNSSVYSAAWGPYVSPSPTVRMIKPNVSMAMLRVLTSGKSAKTPTRSAAQPMM